MTQIPGTNVAGPVVPFDTADIYPAHIDQHGQGGWRPVQTAADRDAIPAPRRREGMCVYVVGEGIEYVLGADLVTWSVKPGGSGGGILQWPGLDPVALATLPLADRRIPAEAFGIGSDGNSDYTTLLNAAIQYLGALGGGTLVLDRCRYILTETLVVNRDHVAIEGRTIDSRTVMTLMDQVNMLASVNEPWTFPETYFLWRGTDGGTMCQLRSLVNGTNPVGSPDATYNPKHVNGVSLANVAFFGWDWQTYPNAYTAPKAGIGIEVISLRNSQIDNVCVLHCSSVQYRFACAPPKWVSDGAGGWKWDRANEAKSNTNLTITHLCFTTRANLNSYWTFTGPDTAWPFGDGIRLDRQGTAGGDTYDCSFDGIYGFVMLSNGSRPNIAIDMRSCDNNNWLNVMTQGWLSYNIVAHGTLDAAGATAAGGQWYGASNEQFWHYAGGEEPVVLGPGDDNPIYPGTSYATKARVTWYRQCIGGDGDTRPLASKGASSGIYAAPDGNAPEIVGSTLLRDMTADGRFSFYDTNPTGRQQGIGYSGGGTWYMSATLYGLAPNPNETQKFGPLLKVPYDANLPVSRRVPVTFGGFTNPLNDGDYTFVGNYTEGGYALLFQKVTGLFHDASGTDKVLILDGYNSDTATTVLIEPTIDMDLYGMQVLTMQPWMSGHTLTILPPSSGVATCDVVVQQNVDGTGVMPSWGTTSSGFPIVWIDGVQPTFLDSWTILHISFIDDTFYIMAREAAGRLYACFGSPTNPDRYSNLAYGLWSGNESCTGKKLLAIGNSALGKATTAQNVVTVGINAGKEVTTAQDSLFIGTNCGAAATSAARIVGIGPQALNSITTQQNVIGLGFHAGYGATGNNCIFIGSESGLNEARDNRFALTGYGSATNLIEGDFSTGAINIPGSLTIKNQPISTSDVNAVHTNTANEYSKASSINPSLLDRILGERQAGSYAKIYFTISDILALIPSTTGITYVSASTLQTLTSASNGRLILLNNGSEARISTNSDGDNFVIKNIGTADATISLFYSSGYLQKPDGTLLGNGYPSFSLKANTAVSLVCYGGNFYCSDLGPHALSDHTDWAAVDAIKVSKLVASDGNPDPALSADANGILTTFSDFIINGSEYFEGSNPRVVTVNRNTTSNTAGSSLTLNAGGATSGATDKGGGTASLWPGISTGMGASLAYIGRFNRANVSGTADNAGELAFFVPSKINLTSGVASHITNQSAAGTYQAGGGVIFYTIAAKSAADCHSYSGRLDYTFVRGTGAITISVTNTKLSESILSASTMTVSWSTSAGTSNGNGYIDLTVTSSIASLTELSIRYEVMNNTGPGAITCQ